MVLDPLAAFRLDDKVVLVTGASAGLGERFARVVDKVGARVAITARRSDRLDDLARELRDPHILTADLTRDGSAERLVADTIAHFGRIDVLVNNAGFSDPVATLDETNDHFDASLAVNLVAPYRLAREAAREMVARDGGVIVNIASLWGLVGVGQIPEAGYAASKGAIVNLTRELAAQWARKGVRVNALCPGWFPTEMTNGRMFGDPASEKWMRGRTPMGRGGREHELDGALLYLASDASTFATGSVLVVDGGWTAI